MPEQPNRKTEQEKRKHVSWQKKQKNRLGSEMPANEPETNSRSVPATEIGSRIVFIPDESDTLLEIITEKTGIISQSEQENQNKILKKTHTSGE